MTTNDESLIRDDDLRAKLEAQRGKTPVFDVYVRTLISTQHKRDEQRIADEAKAAKLAALPREKRRRSIIREVIEN